MANDQLSTESNRSGASSEEKPALTKEDLEGLLGKRVALVELKNLTAAGDNYGSVMYAVDVVLESGEKLALVAKMFPRNEFAQKLFQSPLSMRKEIDTYVSIRPEFEKIQEEAGIPSSERLRVICECPGARLSLTGEDVGQPADKDSVLLLENLKVQGYRTGERASGVDLKHAEFALKNLARFHATAIAIKLKKNQVFKDKILPALKPFKIAPKTKEEEERGHVIFIEKLKKIPVCEKHIDTIRRLFKERVEDSFSDRFSTPEEPFATILHHDFWTNNMMFKYSDETSRDPIDFKIVDFQTHSYNSPIYDILLFLFTSMNIGIVEDKFDELLKLYHDCFTEWLEKLGCETRDFSFDKFLDEFRKNASRYLPLIMFMLKPITLTKEQAQKFTDGPKFDELDLNENYTKRVSTAVSILAQKGWLH